MVLKILKLANRFLGNTRIFQKVLNLYLKRQNAQMTHTLTVINRQYTR